jgi:DNA-binding CsgD family transcriptional regulator
MNESGDKSLRALLVIVLLTIVVSGAVDLVLDAPDDWRSGHVLYEVVLITAALGTTVVLWRQWSRAERSLVQTRRTLAERQAERDEWRDHAERALTGFADAVDEQLRRWQLTDAEREIALQLLKGRSHKQIAFATARSERTVRQHAVSVYQKSGQAGRAELAAFFLEDLMLPATTPRSPTVASTEGRR